MCLSARAIVLLLSLLLVLGAVSGASISWSLYSDASCSSRLTSG